VLRDEQVWPWLNPQGPARRESGRLGACPPSAPALVVSLGMRAYHGLPTSTAVIPLLGSLGLTGAQPW